VLVHGHRESPGLLVGPVRRRLRRAGRNPDPPGTDGDEDRKAVDRSGACGDNEDMNHESLAREIRRDKAERARQMSLDERLTAGPTLYAEQMRLARSLIVGLHPNWTDAQVESEIFRREELIRQRNTKKYYRTVPATDDHPAEQS